MIQLLPTVMVAWAELNFARGWTTVLDPRVMRCVPVREACSAMIRDDARDVGGLGGAGMVEARLEDIVPVIDRSNRD
jgi:hypothetical protein